MAVQQPFSPHLREIAYIVLDGCYPYIEDGLPVAVYSDLRTAKDEAELLNTANGQTQFRRAIVLAMEIDKPPRLYPSVVAQVMFVVTQEGHR